MLSVLYSVVIGIAMVVVVVVADGQSWRRGG